MNSKLDILNVSKLIKFFKLKQLLKNSSLNSYTVT